MPARPSRLRLERFFAGIIDGANRGLRRKKKSRLRASFFVTPGTTDSGDKCPLDDLRLVIAFGFGTGESGRVRAIEHGEYRVEYSGGQARLINSWSSKLGS